MRILQASRILSRGILLLLVFWGTASFFLFKSPLLAEIVVAVFALIAIFLILSDKGELPLLYFINFINFYAFYGLLFTYNLPLYLIMIGILLVSGSSFFFLGQKLIRKNHFYFYFLLFVILILELFLTLSFWLVNPLTRSLVLVVFVYILFGFWNCFDNEEFDKDGFRNYLVIAGIILVMMLFTVGWGH